MGGFVDIGKTAAPRRMAECTVKTVGPGVIGANEGPRAATALGHRHAAMAAGVAEHAHLTVFAAHRQQGRPGGAAGDVIADPWQRRRRTKRHRQPAQQSQFGLEPRVAMVVVDRRAPSGRAGIGGFVVDVVENPRDRIGVVQNQGHIRLVSDE